jgi:hypothetical protein
VLPTDIVINHVPPAEAGWLIPVIAAVAAIIVALIAAWSLKESDERKKAQEDRRRWDVDLVDTVVEMLVLTDDVTDTKDAIRKKKESILSGELPTELNRHLIRIGLLTNERLTDLAQEVVIKFMTERLAMKPHLEAGLKEGKALDDINDIPGLSLTSTSGEDYTDARRLFLNAFQLLVVSVSVQKFTDIKSTNWKQLVKLVEEEEKRIKKEEEAAKHRMPDDPEPASTVRARIP